MTASASPTAPATRAPSARDAPPYPAFIASSRPHKIIATGLAAARSRLLHRHSRGGSSFRTPTPTFHTRAYLYPYIPSSVPPPPLPPWMRAASPAAAPAAAAAPSLLQHLLGGAVRWKGVGHRARPHTRPPRYRKTPKVREGRVAARRQVQAEDAPGCDEALRAEGRRHLHAQGRRQEPPWRPAPRAAGRRAGCSSTVRSSPRVAKKLRRLGCRTARRSCRRPSTSSRSCGIGREGWTEMFYAAKQKDGVEVVHKMMKAQREASKR